MVRQKNQQSDYERELEKILENYRDKAKDSENEVLHGAMTEKEAFDQLGNFAGDFNQEVLKLKLKHGKLKCENTKKVKKKSRLPLLMYLVQM